MAGRRTPEASKTPDVAGSLGKMLKRTPEAYPVLRCTVAAHPAPYHPPLRQLSLRTNFFDRRRRCPVMPRLASELAR